MDFLTFKAFISTEVLILFYYLGALILPLGVWFFLRWLLKKYTLLGDAFTHGKVPIWSVINRQQRSKLILICITLFLFAELFWRMLFEFLIAYMQIRDALLQLQI